MLVWIAVALALYLVRRAIIALLERSAPRTFWVYADRTPFVGMCTGSPGYTDPLVIGEKLTLRQARKRARFWVFKHPHGEAIIYVNDDGISPTDYKRCDWRGR